MPTIPALVTCTGNNSNVSWTPTSIRTSLIDSTNPIYPRIWKLDGDYLTLSRPGHVAGIQLAAIVPALLALVPQLTWPPLITVQPADAVVTAADSPTFTVTATSELSKTYQWQKSTNSGTSWTNLTNAGVYSGVTTVTMTVSNPTGLNGIEYRCNVTNGSGTTASSAATMTVDPDISTQPASASVAAPAAHTFNVVASGLTALTYQWQLFNVSWGNLSNTGVYTGVTTASLAISNSTGLNGKQYRVIVTDTGGNITSATATLTVT